jgi:transcriptional regulator with XRE-family HTH domain
MGNLDRLGSALRSLRERAYPDLNQEQFAKRFGFDSGNLSRWETDQRWPSRGVLERLLGALDVSLADLGGEMERLQASQPSDTVLSEDESEAAVLVAERLVKRLQEMTEEGEEILDGLRNQQG